MDKISIITICYNCMDDLRMTVESVISQHYPDREYIIIDGGSTDGTLDVIHQYREHISSYVSEPDNGIYDALNKGIRMATGEWILCLNAGDVFTDENTLNNVFAHSDLDAYSVIYSDCLVRSRDHRIVRATMNRSKGLVHHQNAIYRKALHDEHGMYLVTKPYVVSDLLFLLSIEEGSYLKINTPIAISKEGGISCALWSGEQATGLRIALGIEHMPGGFLYYLKLRVRLWLQHITNKR